MAIGRRASESQSSLFVAAQDLPRSPGHPFYERLNQLLGPAGFDRFVEGKCQEFYAPKMGRPGTPPGVYFRAMLVGYFEGIDSERGIAWRCSDSLALRAFLGVSLEESVPDHSTLSRTRRLIDVETHREVFSWVLKLLAEHGLLQGKTVGIDATTLEANAALRSIVRRDDGSGYRDFLIGLAKSSGVETPSRADLAKLDRKRTKKGSNDDWENPHDPDARITRMKDGRTHLAHKAEHAVDLDSGAVLAVTVQPADRGDTQSVYATLSEASDQLAKVSESERPSDKVCAGPVEAVLDKGYHSNEVLVALDELGITSYVSEPDRGRRRWRGKAAEQRAAYGNRRRLRGRRGKQLLRKRGELIERSFAHLLETGGLRRVHLRGHENIEKRYLVHTAAFNLGLVMRALVGRGTPRGLQGLARMLRAAKAGLTRVSTILEMLFAAISESERSLSASRRSSSSHHFGATFATAC